MPPTLIPKLGIRPERRKRKYDSVQMSYGQRQGKTMSQGCALLYGIPFCAVLGRSRGDKKQREEMLKAEAEEAANIQGETAKRVGTEDSSDDEDKATEEWER